MARCAGIIDRLEERSGPDAEAKALRLDIARSYEEMAKHAARREAADADQEGWPAHERRLAPNSGRCESVGVTTQNRSKQALKTGHPSA